jgi:hypothetical protein
MGQNHHFAGRPKKGVEGLYFLHPSGLSKSAKMVKITHILYRLPFIVDLAKAPTCEIVISNAPGVADSVIFAAV